MLNVYCLNKLQIKISQDPEMDKIEGNMTWSTKGEWSLYGYTP